MRGILVALGENDCETLTRATLGQPVNAWSSLAFSVVGLAVVAWAWSSFGRERHFRIVYGLALAATGVGSFLYHGPQGAGSGFLHDVSFLVAVVVLITANTFTALGWSERRQWTAVVVVSVVVCAVVAAVPTVTNVLTAVAAAALVGSAVLVQRSGAVDRVWFIVSVGALALAVLSFALGRTDSPLCEPGSWAQFHAGWHVMMAVALGAYAVASSTIREQL